MPDFCTGIVAYQALLVNTMKKALRILVFGLVCLHLVGEAEAQRLSDIELQDAVSGEVFSLKEYRSSKAVVLIFSSLGCPFSKLYEARINKLYEEYAVQGFVFAMVNPHAGQGSGESLADMADRAAQKGYLMPYLMDTEQKMTRYLEVTKIPEAVVISNGPTGYSVVYKGAIDNNPQSAESAQMKYLESALGNILARKNPSPASTRAVGCNVRLQ
ncbi:redoxin domain-containing protein [Lunatimonas salinarum]|uniref:redoxin domain-containing protein n=1 Tax=Lunatimonas salinarum TaxID=1774590 RepID=UPI001FD829E2|nr:redoxin domain-containing protein [Lunatimonas salinarum]